MKKPPITKLRRQIIMNQTRELISRLSDPQILKGKEVHMTEYEITNICYLLADQFLEEPPCLDLDLKPDMYIVGDIYGHYTQLLQLLDKLGHPPNSCYLFLGNYINRGPQSLETIVLLFAYKLIYPQSIYLLRGNHESKHLTERYGFYNECIHRYGHRLWKLLIETFGYLPAAAFIERSIFCTHSGISPSILYAGCSSPQQVQNYIIGTIQRPTDIESNLILTHLLWSEPDYQTVEWERNPAGLGYLFGTKIVNQMCEQFKIQQFIRSNCFLKDGYEFFPDSKLVTIFSIADFMDLYRNNGTVIYLILNHDTLTIDCHFIINQIIRNPRRKLNQNNLIIQDNVVKETSSRDWASIGSHIEEN